MYKLYTTDAEGNFSNVATNTAVVTNTADAGIIDLTDAGVAGTEGQLIAPAYEGGNWYFHWDRNSGSSVDLAGDSVTQTTLHDTFIHDSTFTMNNGGAGNALNDTYRYARLNDVTVSVPIIGTGNAMNTLLPDNQAYTGLAEIWDTYNGVPPGWSVNSSYWSASPAAGDHAGIDFVTGLIDRYPDSSALLAALQVL